MYYFIVNPSSRQGRGEKIWNKLEKLLKKKRVEYEAYLTQHPGDARMIAKMLTKTNRDEKVIVAVGGDGTLNEVLDGTSLHEKITLGYIPAGSGNDFARSLRMPASLNRCVKRILSPKCYQLLDYGVLTFGSRAEHRRFAVSAGIGIDGAVCHEFAKSSLSKRPFARLYLARLGYIFLGLKQLFFFKPCKGYLILDQVKKIEFNHIFFMSAHIHPFEGGGFQFAPRASGTSGKLTICVVSNEKRRNLIPILASALLTRKKGRRGIRTFECREAFFHVERPMEVHTDGEPCGIWNDLQAECIGKKIRFIM